MRIFIGWSGERSRLVALELRSWLRTINPSFQAWMSEEDIARGARWSQELDKELEAASVGILCLTHENLLEPYIHYEAGALGKQVSKSRVFTYLIGLKPNDISGPLASYQHTSADQPGSQKLLEQLNSLLDRDCRHEPEALQRAFSRNWEDLNSAIASSLGLRAETPAEPVRKDRELLDEILATVRELAKKPEPADVASYLASLRWAAGAGLGGRSTVVYRPGIYTATRSPEEPEATARMSDLLPASVRTG